MKHYTRYLQYSAPQAAHPLTHTQKVISYIRLKRMFWTFYSFKLSFSSILSVYFLWTPMQPLLLWRPCFCPAPTHHVSTLSKSAYLAALFPAAAAIFVGIICQESGQKYLNFCTKIFEFLQKNIVRASLRTACTSGCWRARGWSARVSSSRTLCSPHCQPPDPDLRIEMS